MKKIYAVFAFMFLALCASAQICGDKECPAVTEAKKTVAEVKKSKTSKKVKEKKEEKYDDKLRALASSYAAAKAKDKPKIEKDIRALLAAEEDKKIAFAKEQAARQAARLEALKERAASLEKNKAKEVDDNFAKIKAGETESVINGGPERDFPIIAPFAGKESK
jgi:hypothetical protein